MYDSVLDQPLTMYQNNHSSNSIISSTETAKIVKDCTINTTEAVMLILETEIAIVANF